MDKKIQQNKSLVSLEEFDNLLQDNLTGLDLSEEDIIKINQYLNNKSWSYQDLQSIIDIMVKKSSNMMINQICNMLQFFKI